MNNRMDDISREAIERRLLDRYVNTVDDNARAAFVGTGGRASLRATLASKALGMWPRIKAIPVVGAVAYRAFTRLRRSGG